MDYSDFIASRQQSPGTSGFEPNWMPDWLFPFQVSLVEWAIRIGRGAIFADCGLGKTPMALVWAENVIRHTGKPVLFVTPLAVGPQIVREAEKFGVSAVRSRDGVCNAGAVVYVTNYEQLHKFDADMFAGVVCDESSAIKNFKSARKETVVEFMRTRPYRLLCTATAAPNDFWELGTSSEALGLLGFRDMITTFFKQDTAKDHLGWGRTVYRFRGHAQQPFWRWAASWSRSIRRPSDHGFDDGDFILPPLNEREYVVETKKARAGRLFATPAQSLPEQREERRNSIGERCDMAAKLVHNHDGPSVIWCELNDEGRRLTKEIDGAVEVRGSMKDEQKEELLTAFGSGEIKRLVTKPKIGCWGLNWQHCSNVVVFPSHSFEQYYQSVRRCWRFGQKSPVNVHVVVNEGEIGVLKSIKRKSEQAEQMFDSLCLHMSDAMHMTSSDYFPEEEDVPTWL